MTVQLLTDMELPHLPVEQAAFDADPTPFMTAARGGHPWLAKINVGYFVHGYQAVKDLSMMDDKLRPAFDGVVDYYGAKGTPWGNFMEDNIIAVSGAKHTRIRNSIANAFAPRNINRFRTLMRERVTSLLDEWAPKGQFDFADFAANFPISILCGLLGTSAEAIPRIRHALEAQGQAFSLNRALLPEMIAGYDVMWNYVDTLVTEREKSGVSTDGAATLLDSLIAAKIAGQIDEVELRNLLMILFPAGYDTSKNMLAFTVYMLLQRPQAWQRCAADVEFCAKILEEMLRYCAISTPFRLVGEEFVYNEVRFPKDAWLFFGNTVAGRDPAAFTDPDAFEPERVHSNRHVAFGRGAHMCVGQHLARTQIVEGLHLIAQRLRNPRLAGPVTWRAFLGTRGPSSLPIAFETAS
jgi:cytochrome P450